MPLAERIERLFHQQTTSYGPEYFEAFAELKEGLNQGTIRAAEPDPAASPTGWRVNGWVKMGILLGFRIGVLENMSADHGRFPFFDKSTFPLRKLSVDSGVRMVPGGSSIRDGTYVARGVTCMPPMYINVGAYVDEGTLIDSHALVGSCAQVGKRVHLSAASQLGGVLEPVGALPVIIEDDVLVGGNCGVYEGTVVKRRAVLGAGQGVRGVGDHAQAQRAGARPRAIRIARVQRNAGDRDRRAHRDACRHHAGHDRAADGEDRVAHLPSAALPNRRRGAGRRPT